jgi:hypothetical protein
MAIAKLTVKGHVRNLCDLFSSYIVFGLEIGTAITDSITAGEIVANVDDWECELVSLEEIKLCDGVVEVVAYFAKHTYVKDVGCKTWDEFGNKMWEVLKGHVTEPDDVPKLRWYDQETEREEEKQLSLAF